MKFAIEMRQCPSLSKINKRDNFTCTLSDNLFPKLSFIVLVLPFLLFSSSTYVFITATIILVPANLNNGGLTVLRVVHCFFFYFCYCSQVLINLVALPQETLTAKLTGVALPQEWSPRVEHPLTSDLNL